MQRYHKALLLMEGLQHILSDQADVENIAKCECRWAGRGRPQGRGGERGPPNPAVPHCRQAVHRAETLGVAERPLCLTRGVPGSRGPRG